MAAKFWEDPKKLRGRAWGRGGCGRQRRGSRVYPTGVSSVEGTGGIRKEKT